MEEDRAAKAARAKALLNKRRANKPPASTTTATSNPPSAHPSPPPSAYSPSVTNQVSPPSSVSHLPEEVAAPAPVSQERVATPESRRNSRSNGADPYAALVAARTRSPLSSPPMDDAHLQKMIHSQQQTISLLVTEKASLAATLERLEGLDEKYGSVSGQLEASKRAAQTLEARSRDLEEELARTQRTNDQLTAREKELDDKVRQRERDLELSKSEAASAREKSMDLATKLRDLQEQIQADDRAEKLEASLKSLQDRSNSLESQLVRTKQALTESNVQKEEALTKYNALLQAETDSKTALDSLTKGSTELQAKIQSLETERSTLQSTNSELVAKVKEHDSTLSDMTRKLSVEGGKAALQDKKIKGLQAELIGANRRAEEAEHAHKGLQNENVGLMASLNEMRPRLMALTEEKLNLTEQIERLEEARYALEGTISTMELEAEEFRAKYEALEEEKTQIEASRDGDQEGMAQELERHLEAINRTEEELQSALKSVKELESERTIHRQAVERYQVEMDKLDAELADLRSRYTTLQDEFSIVQGSREQESALLDESHGVIERANAEVEALRNELYSKEEELEQLKAEVNPTSAKTPRGHHRSSSLDKEMFESDGTFELSAARAKIRSLETTVFQEQAKSHNLRKHVSSLEEELHKMRRTSLSHHATPSGHSPAGSHVELPVSNALDSALPPDVRHKRKISLSMLKARIDGEAALSLVNGASPRPALARKLPSALDTMLEEEDAEADEKTRLVSEPGPSSVSSMPMKTVQRPRSQFLDDSHIFWCSCCRGDLVVL